MRSARAVAARFHPATLKFFNGATLLTTKQLKANNFHPSRCTRFVGQVTFWNPSRDPLEEYPVRC
jgi:hypothetical protein